jgi:hypothetical protein
MQKKGTFRLNRSGEIMPLHKGKLFAQKDVFIDYPFENVMYRWDHIERKVYVRFYGEDEKPTPIPHEGRLFNDAILSGDEITRQQYEQGKRPKA